MWHEKNFTRKDGSIIKVVVSFYTELNYQNWHWNIGAMIKPKGKRKFIDIDTKKFSEYVTKPEELEVKLELWNKLKPKI